MHKGRAMYVTTFALLLTATLSFAEQTAIRIFPVSDHGSLQLSVPTSWSSEMRSPPDQPVPTIAFGPGGATTYRVLLTPVWPARADQGPLPSQAVKQMVENAAQGAKAQAVEKSLAVKQIKSGARIGYYFSATDRAPKPGEYKYMTQGMLGVGELMLTFTILTNDGYERVVADALTMIKSAVHLKGKEL